MGQCANFLLILKLSKTKPEKFKKHCGIIELSHCIITSLPNQLRIATTGFIFAACVAGIIPARIPTTKQMPTAQTMFEVEI